MIGPTFCLEVLSGPQGKEGESKQSTAASSPRRQRLELEVPGICEAGPWSEEATQRKSSRNWHRAKRGCSVHCRMLSGMPALCLLGANSISTAVTVKNVSNIVRCPIGDKFIPG